MYFIININFIKCKNFKDLWKFWVVDIRREGEFSQIVDILAFLYFILVFINVKEYNYYFVIQQ